MTFNGDGYDDQDGGASVSSRAISSRETSSEDGSSVRTPLVCLFASLPLFQSHSTVTLHPPSTPKSILDPANLASIHSFCFSDLISGSEAEGNAARRKERRKRDASHKKMCERTEHGESRGERELCGGTTVNPLCVRAGSWLKRFWGLCSAWSCLTPPS